MNIVAHNPANFLSSNQHDRFGMQVKSIKFTELAQLPHGCVIFGLADDTGIANVGGRVGARLAPKTIREKLYRFTCEPLEFPIYDLGDLQAEADIASTHHNAFQIILQIHQAGHLPIILGGGHDLGYPQAKAMAHFFTQKIHVINVDAHLDLRSTENGITSGSPWYLLLEDTSLSARPILTEFGIQAHCNSKSLWEYAKKKSVKIFKLSEMKQPVKNFSTILNRNPKQQPILFSLDIDSIQSSQAPGCSAPQVLGFTAAEAIEFCRVAGAHPLTASFGLFECSPPLDVQNATAALSAHCIYSFLNSRSAKLGCKINPWATTNRTKTIVRKTRQK